MDNKYGATIDQTIEYYEKNASCFIESTINVDVSALYKPFEELLAPGCRILVLLILSSVPRLLSCVVL